MNLRVFIFFLMFGWIALMLQSTIISYLAFKLIIPDLLLMILVHAGVHRRGADGVGLAVSYGYLMDLFSGRTFGLFIFIYITIFIFIRVLSVRLLFNTRYIQFLLTFFATILNETLLFILDHTTFKSLTILDWLYLATTRAIINALLVSMMFPILLWLDRWIWPAHKTIQDG